MGRFAIIASALFTVVGCGDDAGPNQFQDAAPDEDASTDGPSNPTTVNVTALARVNDDVPAQTPRDGVLVFAVSATGTLVDSSVTNAQGQATVSLPDGGSVTAVYPSSGETQQVVTYAGVQPGDNLTFGDRKTFYTPNTGSPGTFTLSWPAVTDAIEYRVYTPCYQDRFGTTATSVGFDLYENCQAATGPLGLVAYADDVVLASMLIPDAAYTPNSALALTADQWVAQAAEPNYAAMVTGLDADSPSILFGAYDDMAEGELLPFYVGDFPLSYASATPVAGTAMAALSVATTAPRPSIAVRAPHGTHEGRKWLFKAGASPVTYDASTLPWIQALTIDSKNTRLTWTPTAGAADAMILRFSNGSQIWTLILPPTVTTLDPTLAPPELASYLPVASDNIDPIGCQLVDLASTASYDELRMLPEWRATSAEQAVRYGDEPSAAAYSDCGEGYHF